MDDEAPSEEKTRKTVSLTHRQLGVGAGALVAMMSLGQLKELKEFVLGDTAATVARIEVQQKEGFARIEKLMKENSDEETARMRHLKDATWIEIASSENRCEKRTTELKADISALQIFAFKTRGHGSQN